MDCVRLFGRCGIELSSKSRNEHLEIIGQEGD